MRFFEWSKDGGPESHVDAFFVIEIKRLFTVALLKFNEGTRENFHSHAFNARTLWLSGEAIEELPSGQWKAWRGWQWKYTPRNLMHRVKAVTTTYALTFRGPWLAQWREYNKSTGKTLVLTNGRKVVQEF